MLRKLRVAFSVLCGIASVLPIIAGTLLARVTYAGVLYTSHHHPSGPFHPSSLAILDPQNGNLNVIGQFEGIKVHDIAFDTSRRVLYGIAEDVGYWGQPNFLIRIDPKTASYERIGLLGTFNATALVYDPRSDNLYAAVDFASIFASVDRNTGLATRIGTQQNWLSAFGYVPKSQAIVYATAQIHEFGHVDPSSGDLTLLNLSFPEIYGFAYHVELDTLFAITYDSLYSVDPESGESRLVTTLVYHNYEGLAYDPIPEPSAVRLVLFLLTFARVTRRNLH
jgi:hypothetical protein